MKQTVEGLTGKEANWVTGMWDAGGKEGFGGLGQLWSCCGL